MEMDVDVGVDVEESMNRTPSNGSRRAQQQTSSPTYLLIFFMFSLFCVIFLPSLSPLGRLLPQVSKKIVINFFFKKSSSAPPPPTNHQPTQSQQQQQQTQQIPHFSSGALVAEKTSFSWDANSRALEPVVLELQRMLQMERERILKMEHEIRLLQISANFLKERIHLVEERAFNSKPHRDFNDGSLSNTDLLMQHADSLQRKQESLNSLVQELSKMMQWEKERTSALASEVSSLRQSEALLLARVKILEENLNEVEPKKNRKRTYAFDGDEYEL